MNKKKIIKNFLQAEEIYKNFIADWHTCRIKIKIFI